MITCIVPEYITLKYDLECVHTYQSQELELDHWCQVSELDHLEI